MAGYSVIKHKDKEIHLFDYRGCGDEEVIRIMTRANKIMERNDPEELYYIADFTGLTISKTVVNFLNSEETVRASKRAKRGAVIGVEGLKKIILNSFNMLTGKDCRAFSDIESAKSYLIDS